MIGMAEVALVEAEEGGEEVVLTTTKISSVEGLAMVSKYCACLESIKVAYHLTARQGDLRLEALQADHGGQCNLTEVMARSEAEPQA